MKTLPKILRMIGLGVGLGIVTIATLAPSAQAQRLGNDSQDFFRLGNQQIEQEVQRLNGKTQLDQDILRIKPQHQSIDQPPTQPPSNQSPGVRPKPGTNGAVKTPPL